MTISDECLNSVLLQGSQGLDHLVWREQWEQCGMEEVARSKHKHHCSPAFVGKRELKSHWLMEMREKKELQATFPLPLESRKT